MVLQLLANWAAKSCIANTILAECGGLHVPSPVSSLGKKEIVNEEGSGLLPSLSTRYSGQRYTFYKEYRTLIPGYDSYFPYKLVKIKKFTS